jgi:hypothetical protein
MGQTKDLRQAVRSATFQDIVNAFGKRYSVADRDIKRLYIMTRSYDSTDNFIFVPQVGYAASA